MERRLGPPLLLLWFALGAATLLRFVDLSGLPPAHYRDVATTATDALRAASGHPRLHYAYDEGLYSNLMGLVFLLLGASDWTVRAPGALFGVLTCLGVFRLGKALGQERAGLFGAVLLAVSFWHVLLSRSGFRAILLPCLLVHSIALLVEGLGGRGAWRPIVGGALFGLGIHVYPAFRFAPLLLPAYLLVEWSRSREGRGTVLRNILLFGAAAFAVASPMLLHYLHHPEHFNYPHRVLSVFSPKVTAAEVPAHLAANLKATLLMFHVSGDANWRHNLSGAPMLDPLTGLLFLLGLVLVWRRPARMPALLLGWLGALLLPNLLSVEGVPHGLRSSGVLPAVALLAGAGLESAVDFLARRRRPGEGTVLAAGVVALILIGDFTAYRYFVIWGHDPRMAEAHDVALKAAARVLRDAPPGVERFLVANGTGFPVNGHPVEAEVYLFELRDRPPVLLGPKDAGRLALSDRPALVALIRRDDRILGILRQLNPQASIVEVGGPGLSPESPVYRVN
ncbi:MAG TPA: glycosyltransferase family 39 protein [Candidatus Polarisedimenticolia bacterium]|jgi:4-amino-4-deoxy-L-arabinose transferase-like glycosyltransferase|nr:glycosyltransferase family 39 protein [Candidatus Polarisedimenticolia bacterium]